MKTKSRHDWIDVTPGDTGLGHKEYRCIRCGQAHFHTLGNEETLPPEDGCPVGEVIDQQIATNCKNDIRGMLEAISEAHSEIHSVLDRFVGEGEGQWFTVGEGFWECEKSPVGICVYHKIHDRAHDSCIFCGEPEERK